MSSFLRKGGPRFTPKVTKREIKVDTKQKNGTETEKKVTFEEPEKSAISEVKELPEIENVKAEVISQKEQQEQARPVAQQESPKVIKKKAKVGGEDKETEYVFPHTVIHQEELHIKVSDSQIERSMDLSRELPEKAKTATDNNFEPPNSRTKKGSDLTKFSFPPSITGAFRQKRLPSISSGLGTGMLLKNASGSNNKTSFPPKSVRIPDILKTKTDKSSAENIKLSQLFVDEAEEVQEEKDEGDDVDDENEDIHTSKPPTKNKRRVMKVSGSSKHARGEEDDGQDSEELTSDSDGTPGASKKKPITNEPNSKRRKTHSKKVAIMFTTEGNKQLAMVQNINVLLKDKRFLKNGDLSKLRIDENVISLAELCKPALPIGEISDNFEIAEDALKSRRLKSAERRLIREKAREENTTLEEVKKKIEEERLKIVQSNSDVNELEVTSTVKILAPEAPSTNSVNTVQLQIQQDGTIGVDSESLMLNRHKNEGNEDKEREEENKFKNPVNFGTYGKFTYSERWSSEETLRFYQALASWGTDFSILQQLFPYRTRKQVKNKFNLEERRNPELIGMALMRKLPPNLEKYCQDTNNSFKTLEQYNQELKELKVNHERQLKEMKELQEKSRLEDIESQRLREIGRRTGTKKVTRAQMIQELRANQTVVGTIDDRYNYHVFPKGGLNSSFTEHVVIYSQILKHTMKLSYFALSIGVSILIVSRFQLDARYSIGSVIGLLIMANHLYQYLSFEIKESLLVIPNTGIQITSTRINDGIARSSKTLDSHFISNEYLSDIVINEAFQGNQVVYYMVAVTRKNDKIKLLVIFPKLLPRLNILQKILANVGNPVEVSQE
ncbi:RNA polymerase III transcription factor subunit [Komagataella phaffii CBS 7435]|uniref:Essential subunit of RNA polymerase III transcription factor (TFIIIB), which is involved in transcri n=2 Tax=Komagataella phaffii TaxID=460519 RepID=C4R2K6_KOMPG|nr:Essential subunit of RNA polymerase III transcription factor (TFIIIB), which is involved in transcri [Komagataella phaffii GS115]CAH2447715.1 RNA polymerase III transcription factor subunit [Komagataella phaffii CBS 7435]CAY69730.1 Essential subunit of RNA polymerase III transcription factor (TFIIIB), which is involved in transcri [Komagataella phaffii GS115]CCA37896.1 RNA polymerase III transcription factor subunit [Komagataella phaffii CBS 7435]